MQNAGYTVATGMLHEHILKFWIGYRAEQILQFCILQCEQMGGGGWCFTH